ncbi:hypothetical protein OUZ56_012069 [Daphnia magna]|uniref:Uncharacterized protein n=1 Tax=Daphnia magna TaxID=35525 RepID=A0ABQ9Z1Z1_9CRUS|nr:hypothetical protein OUZ56_012069 [Daphnia magna]
MVAYSAMHFSIWRDGIEVNYASATQLLGCYDQCVTGLVLPGNRSSNGEITGRSRRNVPSIAALPDQERETNRYRKAL